jgi:Ca2+-binding RTX toxin-like protein
VIDNVTGTSGFDANADCDVLDASDEFDLQSLFEVKETGSGNDCLIGVTAVDETFIPGDGNDDITGNVADVPPPAGSGDTIDYSSSSAAMTIDPGAGTATGQGDDTFTDVLGFIGSDFDDTLLWNSAVWGFAGGGGIDTVDASAKTTAQVIDLDLLDDLLTADSTENAIGGSGDDFLGGNDLRNVLTGNDGNDFLEGWGGNDTMFGGLGNDDFWGGLGADTVDFGASPAKIEADVQVGFASGEGDDSFSDFPEIVKGSAFNDTITGGGGIISINFRFTGRNGKDLLTGSGSNDTLKGGKGNDKLRGLEGGDTLVGGKGTNDKAWGGPGTDVCKGVEWERSCEI